MTQPPADWYDDGSGRLRYWDGSMWTEHFADTYRPAATPSGGYGQAAPRYDQAQPGYGQPSSFGPAHASEQSEPSAQASYTAPPSSGAQPSPEGYTFAPSTAGAEYYDPFSAPPSRAALDSAGAQPRKRMAGWVIAVIVGGVVLVVVGIGVIAAVLIPMVNSSDNAAGDDFAQGFADAFDEDPAVPVALGSAYWNLDDAYWYDSCEEFLSVTTVSYQIGAGVVGQDCVGAFLLDEAEVGFYGVPQQGQITGDTATLLVLENSIEDGIEYGTYADYSLVLVDGGWLFDYVTYADTPEELGYSTY